MDILGKYVIMSLKYGLVHFLLDSYQTIKCSTLN
jgi:hypothetical protein